MINFCIREFFRSAEQSMTGIADDNVNPAKFLKRAVNQLMDFGDVCHIQNFAGKGVGIFFNETGDLVLITDGSDNLVASLKKLSAQPPSTVAE